MKRRLIYSVVLFTGLIMAGSSANIVYGQDKPKEQVNKQVVEYTCPMHPEVVKKQPGKCPKCGMSMIEKKAKQSEAKMYTCSKHPEVVKEQPGKCPKCGMSMVEKKMMPKK